MNRELDVCLFVLLLVVIAGCTSHPKRVACEERLQAINAPAPLRPSESVQP